MSDRLRGLKGIQQLSAVAFIALASVGAYYYFSFSIASETRNSDSPEDKDDESIPKDRKEEAVLVNKNCRRVLILYGTTTGTAERMAEELYKSLRSEANTAFEVTIKAMKDYEVEKLEKENIVLFLCSTWTDGQPPESCVEFFEHIRDLRYDFRVSKDVFKGVVFATFGLGSLVYSSTSFCRPVIELDELMRGMGAIGMLAPYKGDDATDLEYKYKEWSNIVKKKLAKYFSESSGEGHGIRVISGKVRERKKSPTVLTSASNPVITAVSSSDLNGDGNDQDEEEEEDRINNKYVTMDTIEETRLMASVHDDDIEDEESDDDQEDEEEDEGSDGYKHGSEDGEVVDLEDLGETISKAKKEREEQLRDQDGAPSAREMVTKLQRKALTKEGYKIIGSHSAVKLCRWTKNQMRGRGGCYKHSFYGITSYQCMEATPSLACANKCVFCWRHHKNPVGTEWRWKTDEPEMIVDTAISLHQGMINEMRGVPGVQPERLAEAFNVRHCALSLVGEPIMYPRINEMLKALHDRGISSFLVTNAQFPERISQLDPVTQLYVSVDAATKDSLKAIDRPLFRDFWERFVGSLDEMKRKQQRTVYRLTLVKSWNMDEAESYADLIQTGQPDFIEIKAVTYCGKSDASSLTMQNVPWHTEVCSFGEVIADILRRRGKGAVYSIATEHEHSCCILLAREDKFKPDGCWHTWIDYKKFTELITEYYSSGGTSTFSSTEYMAPTPSWALYQSVEKGFDPIEERWRRTKAGTIIERAYQPSGSGCG